MKKLDKSMALTYGAVAMAFFAGACAISSIQFDVLTFIMPGIIGIISMVTAIMLVIVLYVTRADSLLGEESPSALIQKLEQRMSEERLVWRVLDVLHGQSLVDGLQMPAATGAAPSSPSDSSSRLSLIHRLVPLVYSSCTVHGESLRVVAAAFALLTSVAPLEEADVALQRALLHPSCLRTLITAMRRHVSDRRAARYGALALGIVVNATCCKACGDQDGDGDGDKDKDSPAVEDWPAVEDLRDASDVCVRACEMHPVDRDVLLWCLYALLHMAAADDAELAGLGGGGGQDGQRAARSATKPRSPIILSVRPGSGPATSSSVLLGSRPYTLCAFIGERGAVSAATLAMTSFSGDERLASVAILLLGVLAKSRADNWALMLRCGSFEAVRHAVTTHRSSDKVMEVGTALLSVDNKFRTVAGLDVMSLPVPT